MTFISYAQNFEDVMLWRALKTVGAGFYIDVGAAHPDNENVTKALYERGWSGVNIEPVAESARLLKAARSRDVTLQVALGEMPGRATFFVVAAGANTGLSTTIPSMGVEYRARFDVAETEVDVDTLSSVCRRYASGPIHVLKVDVEGAERAVLAGGDWATFRPWVVLVEATAPMSSSETHAEWEGMLLSAGYVFVWFDGLNRFYVAEERHAELGPHFRVPPNTFDDFVCANGTYWARLIGGAEALAQESASRAHAAEERGGRLAMRMARDAAANAELERLYRERDAERHALAKHVHFVTDQALGLIDQVHNLTGLLANVHASTSWRITAPLRGAVSRIRRIRHGRRPETARLEAGPVVVPPIPNFVAAEPLPSSRVYARPLREVHQYHSDSSAGDAITASMLLTRRLLREGGYHSHIYVENRASALTHELRLLDELPAHDDYVLIVQHSMGQRTLARILALPVPKVLMYHNITPPRHLDSPAMREAARVGRDQLARLRPHVAAALADSEFNALELRALGFDPVRTCTLLIDPAEIAKPARAPDNGRPFTVLFVGRVVESKGQLELIESFARFADQFGPARLVLVGRHGGEAAPYLQSLGAAIRRNNLDGMVAITGAVSDAERDEAYASADLYVSLSQHEGFGVPLVEAMANGIPVLAWAVGAVADTLGGAGELLDDPSPTAVAARMLALARDRPRRAAMAEAGRLALSRFDPRRHMPRLVEAIVRAGAALPLDPSSRPALAASMHFAVMGQVNGRSGLAAINRALATALEAGHPGRVRIMPVEGGPTEDLSAVPLEALPAIARLAGRAAPETGPEVVISHHHPVYVPPNRGDLLLALIFSDESLLPAARVAALARFDGAVAPSRYVAKALVDSGVTGLVRLLGYAPPLQPFFDLYNNRAPDPGAPTVFLHVSSCLPRNGVDVLLAAYARTFRLGDPVELVIKGRPDAHQEVPAQIARLIADDPRAPPIRYIDDDLDEASLLALYRAADAMVLPTRGQGCNLPALEALAAGLPLVATGLGGHLDHCGPDEARLLDFAFGPSRGHAAIPGSVWAEPDVDDLVAALREVVEDPEPARARAARGRRRLAREVNPDALVTRLTGIATELLTMAPAEPPKVAWISTWGVRCGVAEYSRNLVKHAKLDRVTVLADLRPPEPSANADAPPVRQVWSMGETARLGEFEAAIATEDPDIIVVQHQPGLIPWTVLGPLLTGRSKTDHVPMVVTLHSTRHLLVAGEEERTGAIRGLHEAARVLVHTIEDLNRLKRFGLSDNVTLLPHGVHSPRAPRPTRTLDHTDPVLIGCHGFLLPDKGVPQLIEAMELIRERRPNVRLRLVNALYPQPPSTIELAACQALVASAGLAEAVEFVTGFLPDAGSIDLLAECDLIVLPYQASQEATSGALRTALASGVPIAVTPLSVFDENEDSVLRLPGFTPGEIARGIEAVLADAVARSASVGDASSWMAARDWHVVGARLAGILRNLAAERP